MHGGSRQGAGRKPGARNKKTEEVLIKAKETGLLPHEFLLQVARGETINGYTPDFKERLAAARDAAPYYAPKLSQIDAKIEETGTHYLICDKPLDIDEFTAKYGIGAVENDTEIQ
jgi:hypothetical protein